MVVVTCRRENLMAGKDMKMLCVRILLVVCTLLYLNGCVFDDTVIQNKLNVPAYVELKTTVGESLTGTIQPRSGLTLRSSPEAHGKRYLLSCIIRTNDHIWVYNGTEIARLSQGRRGHQVWEIGAGGLSRKY